jgi:amino acid adenylation domain-containing protein
MASTHSSVAASNARRSLDGFFTTSLHRHAARPAVFVGDRSWSYWELDGVCRDIQHELLREEADAGNVGVITTRSAVTYAAVIAVMRAGCVYVPLNPRFPEERLLRIIRDAEIRTVIVDASDADAVALCRALAAREPITALSVGVATPENGHAETSRCATSVNLICGTRATAVARPPAPAGLAYIIYTSGSTGMPKGVAVTHESACNCVEKLQQLFGTDCEDSFTQFNELSFDLSVADMFLCWMSGACLYVPAASQGIVPMKFAITHGITVWSSVPSLASISARLGMLRPGILPRLRFTLFCGEALPAELAHTWAAAAPQCRVFNLYGPTETTIYATYHEFDPRRDARVGVVPIGVPLPGLSYSLAGSSQIDGSDVGELWLSGDQLALGYWRNALATSRAFVSVPDGQGRAQTWYRTGDLASYDPALGLIFRGRADRQVKLHGYRVELQDVEAALRRVTECSVVAVVPRVGSAGLVDGLVAFCETSQLDEHLTRQRCLEAMPSYVVPHRIVALASLPLSEHGKVDYKRLAVLASSDD